MKRRILSILMCLCMALCLLPTAALADTEYNVWVGGKQVTSANAGSVTGDGIIGTVSYDAASSTLTLSDASITGAYTDGNSNSAAIYAGADLTIQLIGGNTVIGPNTESSYSIGVYGTNALTVTGSGSLNATGGTAGVSCGVRGTSISVTGGAVTATGGTAGSGLSRGVFSVDSVTVQAAGALTATGGAAENSSIGVDCDTVEADGTLTATGGEVIGKGVSSCGISCYDSVTVQTAGALTATGGAATETGDSSCGIFSDGSSFAVQTAGTLTATGGAATETGGSSCGVYGTNTITLSGTGTVTATGGEVRDNSARSCGVYGEGSVTLSGTGTVTATGGAAGGSSYGVYGDCGIFVTGGTTTATGGAVTSGTSRAMNEAPDLNSYTASHCVIASNNADGSSPASYNASNIATYKYLKIVPLYALTVNLNGGSGTTATGNSYLADTVIPIDAGTKSDYTFSGWTATGGGAFANASGASTTYTMPAGAATVTATWMANSYDDGTSTTAVPVSGGSGAVNLSVSISGSTATVSATDAQLQKITSGTETGAVKIDASDLKADAVVVPSKLVTAANNASNSTGLALALPAGTLTLDKTALTAVAGKGDVKLSVETVSNTKLTDTQKAVLGTQAETALVVDVNVYVNGAKTSTFGDGRISVSVPYKPKSGENTDSITVWFIKDDGTIEPKNGVYNAAAGCVEFTTGHLSQYLIVDFPFMDVAENAWYYGSVAYACNNNLFAGTSATTFSPDTAMTRQMIWMVLARMDGKAPADMDAARAWAMENDISDGSNPTNSITREQMAAILYRYAQHKGYDVSIGEETNILSYDDALTISEYAIPAIQWTCGAGLMQGSSNNLMPSGSATRAQVATILQRFCQNAAK